MINIYIHTVGTNPPTSYPTPGPTNSPTGNPTIEPTIDPIIDPTTNSTAGPFTSSSIAPTRVQTEEDAYDSYIAVT